MMQVLMASSRARTRRRSVGSIALAFVVALIATTWASAVAQAAGKVTLTVWADSPRAAEFKNYNAPGVNLKIDVIPNTTQDRLQKLDLANKAGQGWPDIFEVQIFQAKAFGGPPYNFAANIKKYTSGKVIAQYPKGAMAPCKTGTRVICLPNEIGPDVLWYNKPLMKQFGYQIPTTWQQYLQLGLDVAKNHPGYVVGSSASLDESYLEGSDCPWLRVVAGKPKTIYSNLKDPKCTRMAKLVDQLLTAGTMPRSAASDPSFIQKYGATGKWLVMPAPVWYDQYIFDADFKTPTGDLGIAPPLKWEGASQTWTGNNGGVYYMVSRHSDHIKQAAAVVNWMSNGSNQTSKANVTVPAYGPARTKWLQQTTASGYVTANSGTVGSVMDTAASEVLPDQAFVPVNNIQAGQFVLPLIEKGESFSQTLPAWQTDIDNELQAAGYKVVHSK